MTTDGTPDEAVPEDGRRARRHRSRDVVVDALLELLSEGEHRPTAQQVAERSGVSLRSIFRIFADVQGLHAAATERHLTRVRHLFVDVEAVGTLDERAHTIVATTTRLYDSVAPIRRAAIRVAGDSPTVQAQVERARRWLRGEVDRVFADELERSDDIDLAAAVEVLLSFEAWDQLRTGQGLDSERAMAVTHRAVVTLLG
ncbi:MAG: TetR/AcrR family transcriptional regulator [Acidimicrobiales bacterium]